MGNLYELELRTVERYRELREEVVRDRMVRQAKKEREVSAARPAGEPLRVRLGLLLIQLGARLATDFPARDMTSAGS